MLPARLRNAWQWQSMGESPCSISRTTAAALVGRTGTSISCSAAATTTCSAPSHWACLSTLTMWVWSEDTRLGGSTWCHSGEIDLPMAVSEALGSSASYSGGEDSDDIGVKLQWYCEKSNVLVFTNHHDCARQLASPWISIASVSRCSARSCGANRNHVRDMLAYRGGLALTRWTVHLIGSLLQNEILGSNRV